MPKSAITATCLLAFASVAYGQAGQTIYMPPKPEKRWTESQPLYAPYTGPGYGNPDTPGQRQSAGQAAKKYNDAAGTSAYSNAGGAEPSALGNKDKKRKPPAAKDTKPHPDAAQTAKNAKPKPAPAAAASEQK